MRLLVWVFRLRDALLGRREKHTRESERLAAVLEPVRRRR